MVEFERKVGLGPVRAARLLGMPYISYAQCRSGARKLKMHHVYHIEVLLLLKPEALRARIREVTDGNH